VQGLSDEDMIRTRSLVQETSGKASYPYVRSPPTRPFSSRFVQASGSTLSAKLPHGFPEIGPIRPVEDALHPEAAHNRYPRTSRVGWMRLCPAAVLAS
jgi:hypothetical protein